MVDGMELAKQSTDLGTSVAGEVRADTSLEVGRLPHVEHGAGGIGEPVDTGSVGEPGGEAELGGLRVPDQAWQIQQLLESDDPERAGSFEQGVEEVTGGQHIGQGPVGGLVGEPEDRGQGAQLAVGHHVADQPPGQRQRVDGGIGEAVPSGGHQGMIEKGEVEAKVVADEYGSADELQKGREHLADPGCSGHHGVADAGQSRDERRDPLVGSDQRLVGAEHLTTPVAGGGHLGERRGRRGASGRFDVHHHEGHLVKGCAEVVE